MKQKDKIHTVKTRKPKLISSLITKGKTTFRITGLIEKSLTHFTYACIKT